MAEEPPTKKQALERNGSAAYIPEKLDGNAITTLTFSLAEKKGALAKALKLFDVSRSVAATERLYSAHITFVTRLQDLGVNLTHIESRPSKRKPGEEYDFYVDCECAEESKEEVTSKLSACATNVTLHARSPNKDNEGKYIPTPLLCVLLNVGLLPLLQSLGFRGGFGIWTDSPIRFLAMVLNSTLIIQ